MLEALNILEGYDIQGLRLNSADYIHTLVEALKLAYADRDTYYGDPKFVGWGGGVPVWKNGQVVGAVAVSGLSSSEDIVLATLGVKLIAGPEKKGR